MKGNLEKLKDFIGCALALGRTLPEKWAIFWRQTKNLRVRLGLGRYHPESFSQLPTRYGVLHLRDNFGDVTNLPDLLYRNVYRCHRLDGDGVILDVGANIGLFSTWAAFHNPGRMIYCFEPLASNAQLIPLNCPAAIVSCVALGRERGICKLRVDQQGVMASSIPTAWPTSELTLEMIPLDEFVREHGIRRVAFWKLDAEGMEVEILDGGRETLQVTQRIAIETHGEDRHAAARERLRHVGFALECDAFYGETGLLIASRPAAGAA